MLALATILVFATWLIALKPALLDENSGMRALARELRAAATAGDDASWPEWKLLLAGTRPSAGFYLAPPGHRPDRSIDHHKEGQKIAERIAVEPRTIVVTIRRDLAKVEPHIPAGWRRLEERDPTPTWAPEWVRERINREKHLVAFLRP